MSFSKTALRQMFQQAAKKLPLLKVKLHTALSQCDSLVSAPALACVGSTFESACLANQAEI